MPSLPPLVEPLPELPEAERARTARQTRLPEFGEIGQRRLAGARVLVVGAGGLGAPVLQYLAAAGVGSISIIDDDVVEASSLHRQVIHAHEHLGKPNADDGRRQVLALNPNAQVHVHKVRLGRANAEDILAGHHVVLDGTDTFATRYLVADTCADLGIPLVWGSVLRFDAQVSVFWSAPPRPVPAVTLRDLFPHPPAPGEVPSCAEAGVIGSLCGIAGSIMATEAIKLITGMGQVLLGRVAVIDALSMRVHEVPFGVEAVDAGARAETGQGHAAGPGEPENRAGRLANGPGQREALAQRYGAGPPSPHNLAAAPVAAGPQAALTSLDLEAFLDRREQATNGPVTLVDVREPAEAAQDALPGAVNLPISVLLQVDRAENQGAEIAQLLREHGLQPDQDLVTYCSAGVRAARATRVLSRAGWSSAVLTPEAVDQLRAQVERA